MKLELTGYAQYQLRRILAYYLALGSSKRGQEIVNEILDRASDLLTNPGLGPLEENLAELGEGHRSLLVGRLHKIVYLITPTAIYVTDVFDVRQDPDTMRP